MPSTARRHDRPAPKVCLSRQQKEAVRRLRTYDGPNARLRGHATTLLKDVSWMPKHRTAVEILAMLNGEGTTGHRPVRTEDQAWAMALLLGYDGDDPWLKQMRTCAQRDPHWSPKPTTAERIIMDLSDEVVVVHRRHRRGSGRR